MSRTKRLRISWSSATSRVSRVVLERNGAKYLVLSLASWPRPSYQVPEPRITLRRPARVLSSSVLKSTSMSTGALVSSAPICPPSAISRPLFGPGVIDTYRLAMPDSEVERIVAVVPSWSGAMSSSTSIFTTACAESSRSMSVIVPTGRPPTRTWLPLTSWPAFSNTAVTLYELPRPNIAIETSAMAATSAATAITRATVDPRSSWSGSRIRPSLVCLESKRGQSLDASPARPV